MMGIGLAMPMLIKRDVVNYCRDHCKNPNAELKNYWMNKSGNEIINHFVDSLNQPGMLAKRELERLVNGETVVKRVDEMITCCWSYIQALIIYGVLCL